MKIINTTKTSEYKILNTNAKVLSYEDCKLLSERNLNHILEGLCMDNDFEKECKCILWVLSKGENYGRY